MLGYELRKVVFKHINLKLIVGALLLGVIFSFFAIWSIYYVDRAGESHRGFTAPRSLVEDKSQWKGRLTDSVLLQITRTQQEIDSKHKSDGPNQVYGEISQSYGDIEEFINQTLCYDIDYDPDKINQVSLETAGKIYELRENNIESLINEYGDTGEKAEYLRAQFKKVKTPLMYEPSDSYKSMDLYATTYGLLLVLAVAFLTVGIVSDEINNEARFVYYSTKLGRTRGAIVKISTAFILTTLLYWSCMLLMSFISFGIMGISGGSAPIQIEESYSIYPINFFERFLLILLSGYIASLLSSAISMLISLKTKSALLAVSVPFVLFAGLPFIGRIMPFKKLFMVTPDQLLNVYNNIKIPGVYQIGGVVCSQISLIMLLYSILLIPIAFMTYRALSKIVD